MKQWAQQLSQIRKQVSDLRTTLSQNESTVNEHKESLEEARHKLITLAESPGKPADVLYRLPLILQALNTEKLIAALMMSEDGTVLMHNTSGSRLLGIDPVTNKLPGRAFFNGSNGSPIVEEQLPWNLCLRGESSDGTMHLVMRQNGAGDDMHCEVATVPLKSGKHISGVIVLFRDMTETFQASAHIKRLCTSLEKQMSVAEEALRELDVLSDRLGIESRPQGNHMPVKTAALKRVLIADDIPINHELLLIQLKAMNVDADSVANGAEAVEACETQRYALIFMDLDMPVMNGFKAASEIRKIDQQRGTRTPIVALTAHDTEFDKKQCVQEGMDDFLPKGAGKGRLQEMVDKYVFGIAAPANTPAVAAAPPLKEGDSVLDMEWLIDTFGDDVDRILVVFMDAASTLLNCLDLALSSKDIGAVNHFAFSLKGPCSTIGLTAMSKMAFDLSEDAAHEKWEDAANKYHALRDMLETIKVQSAAMNDGQVSSAI